MGPLAKLTYSHRTSSGRQLDQASHLVPLKLDRQLDGQSRSSCADPLVYGLAKVSLVLPWYRQA